MALLLMTPTAHLPVHGQAYPAAILKPFLRTMQTSWLAPADAPHVCRVAGCELMRAHVRCLWARVARGAVIRHTASLCLSRVFPEDIAARILRIVRSARRLRRAHRVT